MIWKTENDLSCSNYNKVPFVPTLAHKSPRVIFLIKFTLDNFVIVLFELAFEYHLGVGLGFGGSKNLERFLYRSIENGLEVKILDFFRRPSLIHTSYKELRV